MTGLISAGGCLCGSIRYQITGPLDNLCFCHCESCRRASGAPFVAWGTVHDGLLETTAGEPLVVRSSEHVERTFCGLCGSSLTYKHSKRANQIDVTLATLEDPSRFRPESHIWTQDKLDWVSIDDGLPQHKTVLGHP